MHAILPSLEWFSTTTLRPRLDQLAVGQSDRGQIEDVLGTLQDVLGPALIGAYLHGSAVLEGSRLPSHHALMRITSQSVYLSLASPTQVSVPGPPSSAQPPDEFGARR